MAIQNLDELCRFLAPVYAAAGYPAPTAQDVLDAVVAEEEARVARLNRVLHATVNGKRERTLLRDERGSSYGEVTAEIPRDLYFNLMRDKRFGKAALDCPEGIKEVVKQFPGCGVKTVGLKSASRSARERKNFGGINWRGSSMRFAS